MAESDRVKEAQEFGQLARQGFRLPFTKGTPEGYLLDRATGVASGAGAGLFGLASDVAGGVSAALGMPRVAADFEQMSDVNYNTAQQMFQGGYSSGAGRSAADFDKEPADFRPSTAAAVTESPRPRARPEITPELVRQMMGETPPPPPTPLPLSMGQPAPAPKEAPRPTISGAALRLGGPGLQQLMAGAQAQELERVRQSAPGAPLTGKNLTADLQARAAQQILSNRLAEFEKAGGATAEQQNAAYMEYITNVGGGDPLFQSLQGDR
jgi:hypothetical protein